jgi:DNA-3-methyladenine glycosylase
VTAERLPRSFFARDAPVAARALIGQLLVRADVVLRITECEAYCGPSDSASHARHGRTARNAPIWQEPGHVYMYLCYGIHMMLNIVAGDAGRGHAVLVRAAEVLSGLATVVARRRAPASALLAAGPGNVAQALGLDLSFNHHDLCARGDLACRAGHASVALVAGERVGVDYASTVDRRARLRFALAGSLAVTKRSALTAR